MEKKLLTESEAISAMKNVLPEGAEPIVKKGADRYSLALFAIPLKTTINIGYKDT